MIIGQIDVAIRAGAAVTILLLAWLLLRQRRQIGLPALLFAPLSFCVCGFVIGNTPLTDLSPDGLVGAAADMVSGFTVIFLWWFCLSCFDSGFRLKGGVLGVGLAWGLIAALDRGLFGDALARVEWSRLLVPLGFVIIGHLVWRLLAERQGDLIQRRHDARIMVAVLLGGMLFVDLSADVVFGFAWRPLAFAMTQNAMVLGFGLWLAATLVSVRPDILTFGVAETTMSPAGTATQVGRGRDDVLYRRLTALMETERVFLDPELTFAAFVIRMGAPERTVRTLVNRELGHDHFRSFLNHYRVEEARRLLCEQRRSDDKLVAIALDSGFASVASFNRVFRAIEGCAPSQYRTAARQGDIGSHPTTPGFEKRKAGF
ncbi:MAG: helix-turn-helix domain-containing protein [Brevundimonas sp.]|uniref:AraC family transcriptional regulator n=1 Tax=Brevundimonas sp. TaxID=1871086 RepID=UPI0028D8164E|nr:helix-turn-helix domain-containing protein [uncultured Brevundimonas sp.]